MADHDDVRAFAMLRAAGAVAVFFNGLPHSVLKESLIAVIEERREFLSRLIQARRTTTKPALEDFVSSSKAMATFMSTVVKVVNTDSTLLILGETGVGKERLARAIHSSSSRARGPFISVNSAALPQALIESELFGHEEGSFTGATRARRGAFELAHRGTIFLDEIGEMPIELQVKLLHVLEDYAVKPVGGEHPVPVDVRIVAATNRSLQADVEAKRFRQDLFYRLNVITLQIPPLRERREDIPVLAKSYVNEISRRIGKDVQTISGGALKALTYYSWPGNVRELINVIERAILLCDGDIITSKDLPSELATMGARGSGEPSAFESAGLGLSFNEHWLTRPLKEYRGMVVYEAERAYLAALLEETQGRIGETANRAGIEPRSLHGKMKRYGLRKEDYKDIQKV
jgi:DNA-binding NtrC family response regulator